MFKYFLRPEYLTLQICLTLKTSDFCVLSHCVSPIHKRIEALSDAVWACTRERETEKERRGCSLQTPVAVDHYVCVQVSLRVAVGGDKIGRQTKKVESVCLCVCVHGGGSLSGTDIIIQSVIYLTVVSLGLLRLSMTLLYLTAHRNNHKQISYITIRHIWILSTTPDRF